MLAAGSGRLACCGMHRSGRPTGSAAAEGTSAPLSAALHPAAGGLAEHALFFLPCASSLFFHDSPPHNFICPDSVFELEKCVSDLLLAKIIKV